MAKRDADAFEAALAALRRRERATAELRAWLATRGHGPEEIEAAIGRLTEVGELDDERFACRYAEDKRELRGWGAERIREALASRGVAPGARRGGAGGRLPRRPGGDGRATCSPGVGSPWMPMPIARGRSAI